MYNKKKLTDLTELTTDTLLFCILLSIMAITFIAAMNITPASIDAEKIFMDGENPQVLGESDQSDVVFEIVAGDGVYENLRTFVLSEDANSLSLNVQAFDQVSDISSYDLIRVANTSDTTKEVEVSFAVDEDKKVNREYYLSVGTIHHQISVQDSGVPSDLLLELEPGQSELLSLELSKSSQDVNNYGLNVVLKSF